MIRMFFARLVCLFRGHHFINVDWTHVGVWRIRECIWCCKVEHNDAVAPRPLPTMRPGD